MALRARGLVQTIALGAAAAMRVAGRCRWFGSAMTTICTSVSAHRSSMRLYWRATKVEGMVVAGRCFSATHDAHASARSMATCMAMGQAAGTAAAMAVASGTTPRALDVDVLRQRLAEDGALLEPVEPNDV